MEQRLIALEEWMMHMDHLVSKLNGVLCDVQNRLDEQDRTIAQLQAALGRQSDGPEERRSLEEERPPHY